MILESILIRYPKLYHRMCGTVIFPVQPPLNRPVQGGVNWNSKNIKKSNKKSMNDSSKPSTCRVGHIRMTWVTSRNMLETYVTF